MALEALNSPTTATPSFHFEETSIHSLETWTKRKRSKGSHLDQGPTEEEYIALCLIMLARGTTSKLHVSHTSAPPPHQPQRRTTSAASATKLSLHTKHLGVTKLAAVKVLVAAMTNPSPPPPLPPFSLSSLSSKLSSGSLQSRY